jgi:hypothetical protein
LAKAEGHAKAEALAKADASICRKTSPLSRGLLSRGPCPNFSFQLSGLKFQPSAFSPVPISTKPVMIQTPPQPPLSAQLSQKILYLYDKLSQPIAYEQLTTKNGP